MRVLRKVGAHTSRRCKCRIDYFINIEPRSECTCFGRKVHFFLVSVGTNSKKKMKEKRYSLRCKAEVLYAQYASYSGFLFFFICLCIPCIKALRYLKIPVTVVVRWQRIKLDSSSSASLLHSSVKWTSEL